MRLLIVDDSALMRRVLKECFSTERDADLAVARDGAEALQLLHEFKPDVITLDINMPKMDGLTCLAHIMEERPCPVIMVSSLTEKGALATLEALELGAVDFIAKPDGTVSLHLRDVFPELRSKVRSAARNARLKAKTADAPLPMVASPASAAPQSNRSHGPSRAPAKSDRRPRSSANFGRAHPTDLVLIGSSTGGPKVLGPILEDLPASFPAPILIAQHMPERFTRIFAERLNTSCALEVVELADAMPLQPGRVYIAPGGQDVEVREQFKRLTARPMPSDDRYTWHPSVSRMTASALRAVPADRMVAVMLTGMGDDGSLEMAQLHKAGGRTIAESEESAAVFGMPQQLIKCDGATTVLPATDVSTQLKRWVGA